MTLAAITKDVRFYRWPNINYIGIYETPLDSKSIKSISWSCDGRKVVAVKSKGGPVIIQVPNKDQQIEIVDCAYVNHVSIGVFSNINPDVVAYGTDEGYVLIYNIKHTRHPQECLSLSGQIQNLGFSADDQLLAVDNASNSIVLYNSNYKPCASFFIPNNTSFSNVIFSKYSTNLLAATYKDSIVSLWNTETIDSLFTSEQHSSKITDIAFFENGLSSVGTDGKFISYDLRSYKANCCVLDCPLSSLAYLNGTYEIAVSTFSGQIRSYDARNMKSPLKTLVAIANNGIKKIAFPFYSNVCFPQVRKKYLDDFSASGDFSIASGSSPCRQHVSGEEKTLYKIEGDSSDIFETITSNQPCMNLEEINKLVEERLNEATKEFEEKLIQTFYKLRIGTSKKFITLEERILQNWNNFVDYLKLSGEKEAPCTSAVGMRKSCYDEKNTEEDSEMTNNDKV
ncbi:protein NEDD1-like [Diorhabda carinulata]|uniref:protein NEDD1-like n=1 Tax=Diorhabda carinulata TaxID=1163345 RepID=UPI0025A2F607|nr:protein NEDD1-like [Diorhabda carinulata]